MLGNMRTDYDEEAQDDKFQKLNGSIDSDDSSTMSKKPRERIGVPSELKEGFIQKTYWHFSISVFFQLVYVIMISQTTLTDGDPLYEFAKNFKFLLVAITLALIATSLVVY